MKIFSKKEFMLLLKHILDLSLSCTIMPLLNLISLVYLYLTCFESCIYFLIDSIIHVFFKQKTLLDN